jgi:hypothetical protein
MEEDIIEEIEQIEQVGKEVVNLMVVGTFADDAETNAKCIATIQDMVKHFVESLDEKATAAQTTQQRNSLMSIAITFLQTSLHVLCKNAADDMKEKLIQMAFPEYNVVITKKETLPNSPVMTPDDHEDNAPLTDDPK